VLLVHLCANDGAIALEAVPEILTKVKIVWALAVLIVILVQHFLILVKKLRQRHEELLPICHLCRLVTLELFLKVSLIFAFCLHIVLYEI